MPKPEFGKPVDQNYLCDDPTHGYNCYHLEPRRDMSKLSKREQKEFERLLNEFYIESLGDLDREMEREEEEIRFAEDELEEMRADLDGLMEIKRLWDESGLPDDWGKGFLRSGA